MQAIESNVSTLLQNLLLPKLMYPLGKFLSVYPAILDLFVHITAEILSRIYQVYVYLWIADEYPRTYTIHLAFNSV